MTSVSVSVELEEVLADCSLDEIMGVLQDAYTDSEILEYLSDIDFENGCDSCGASFSVKVRYKSELGQLPHCPLCKEICYSGNVRV